MGTHTQANVTYSNEVFRQYIFQLATDLVWKDVTRANEKESSDLKDRYRSDLFILANRNRLSFTLVRSFPRDVISSVFGDEITSETLEIYASDKTKIPSEYHSALVEAYRDYLIDKDASTNNYVNYVETNDYYRMLMGLPNLEETSDDYVYVTDSRWATTPVTPIHQYPIATIYTMESEGYLAELIAENPSKEYLKYVGRRKIDFFNARVAERFALLWRNDSPSDKLNADWDSNYENCRRAILDVYYSNAMKRTNSLYDNFVGMAILFTTIQQLQTLYLKADMTRDFYDEESIKIVYDSYSVPYYPEIPMEYHRKIIKNINKLISNKGSDNVFFEIFEIFDLEEMELYNYFLVKNQLFDDDGIPLLILEYEDNDEQHGYLIDDATGFAFNGGENASIEDRPLYVPGVPVYDDQGQAKLSVDAFDWYFSKIPVGSDPALGIADQTNRVDYDAVISQDPYWIEDSNLRSTLATTDVNFIESKYMGIRAVFDLMNITYESAYIFRIILDNYANTRTAPFYFTWLDLDLKLSIFDLFIYLTILFCKAYGYSSQIIERTYRIPAGKNYYRNSACTSSAGTFPTDTVVQYVNNSYCIWDDSGTTRYVKTSETTYTDFPYTLYTLGYNYDEVSSVLTKFINNQNCKIPTEVKNTIRGLLSTSDSITEISSIDDNYTNISKILDIITDGYTSATSRLEYEAYKELYNALLIAQNVMETYRRPDSGGLLIDNNGKFIYGGNDSTYSTKTVLIETEGTLFNTFEDVLSYYNPDLMQRYLLLEDDDILTEIDLALAKADDLLESINYLPLAFGRDSTGIIDVITKLLKFFKSAKAEIISHEITYVIKKRDVSTMRSVDVLYELSGNKRKVIG